MNHLQSIFNWVAQLLHLNPATERTTEQITFIILMFIVGWVSRLLFRHIVIPVVHRITTHTKAEWDDHFFNDNLLHHACGMLPPIIYLAALPLILSDNEQILNLSIRLCSLLLVYRSVRLFSSVLTSSYNVTRHTNKQQLQAMKGVFQMLKIIVVCIGLIIAVSIFINKNPMSILTGLGASAAILMLVFKDTIVGLVSGVQLTLNDMLRPGDWITAPKYGADGNVIEVNLTTIKVRNWDNTIITLPPYVLVSDSFQNWRGMCESGGRRIKRAINIDMNTIRTLTPQELNVFANEEWMKPLQNTIKQPINMALFRRYVEHLLAHNPEVNTELTMMVRELEPTPEGLPVELYFFAANKDWVHYEHFQSDLFDQLLAALPLFGLKVYQKPAGTDFTIHQKH